MAEDLMLLLLLLLLQDLQERTELHQSELVWRGSPAFGSESDLWVSLSPTGTYTTPEHSWLHEDDDKAMQPESTLVRTTGFAHQPPPPPSCSLPSCPHVQSQTGVRDPPTSPHTHWAGGQLAGDWRGGGERERGVGGQDDACQGPTLFTG
jgi:hypothetical protein